jgi:hypothetical protein
LFLPRMFTCRVADQIIRQQRRAAHALRQRQWLQTASLAAGKNMFPSPAKKTRSRAEQIIAWQQRRGTGAGGVDADGTGAARPRGPPRHGREPMGGHRGVRVLLPRAPEQSPRCRRATTGVPASPVPCVRRRRQRLFRVWKRRARLSTPTPRQEKKRNGVCSLGRW